MQGRSRRCLAQAGGLLHYLGTPYRLASDQNLRLSLCNCQHGLPSASAQAFWQGCSRALLPRRTALLPSRAGLLPGEALQPGAGPAAAGCHPVVAGARAACPGWHKPEFDNPWQATCGHAACYMCWMQYLPCHFKCPVCSRPTRKQQLSRFFFA